VSDARERLRQYLEQRRELGESEYVLDSLSVEEALKVLTTGATPPVVPPRTGAGAVVGAAAGTGGASVERPVPPAPDSAMRRAAEDAAKSGDWREALRAVDAEGSTAPATKPPADPAERPLPEPHPGASLTVGENAPPTDLPHLVTLADVAGAIAKCSACDLGASALNHVPGVGDPDARFVVVGEAPGAKEDELGLPFVGKSGDLLTKILDAIGFKRDDVFICNVLKHRPPGNRNPSSSEVAACRPFLLRQLEILQPKVILALGTFAAQTLLETDTPIGKLRGIEHRYHGIPLIATYHPAALLRNPNWKRPTWEDVQLARRIFDRA
jgi:DNA polymerase